MKTFETLLTWLRTGEGLKEENQDIAQLPSYVTGLPTGKEKVGVYGSGV